MFSSSFFHMKKVFLSLILLAGVASAANAQQARFGVKAGVNLANATGNGSTGGNYRAGFAVGLMGDFSFSDLLSLHPELLYSQKGYQLEERGATVQVRSRYVDVPVLLRVKADGLFFEGGLQAGFLVGQKSEFATAGYGPSSSTSTEGIRKVDLGYVAGVGYQLLQGLELGVRYNGGVFDIRDPSGSNSAIRNSVFQVQVGYLFGGK